MELNSSAPMRFEYGELIEDFLLFTAKWQRGNPNADEQSAREHFEYPKAQLT